MSNEAILRQSGHTFCAYHDTCLEIPSLGLQIQPGECVALLGVKETDIGALFALLNQADQIDAKQPQKGQPGSLQINGHRDAYRRPFIRCIKRKSDLFLEYSALENLLLAERTLLPYSKKQLSELCKKIQREFGTDINLHVSLKNMSISERIIVDIIRSYILNPSVFVFDSLLSLLDFKYADIFCRIIKKLTEKQKHVLYLTTRWEDSVKIASQVMVVMDGIPLGSIDSQSVKQNPQHLIYLLSGRTLVEEHTKKEPASELLNMLYTGAEYLTNNYELSDALKYVAQSIAELMHADVSAIYLLDDISNQLYFFYNSTYAENYELNHEFIKYHTAHAERYEVFYSNFEDINFHHYFSQRNPAAKTLICLPIHVKSKMQGLLQLTYNRYFIYDEQHLLYLRSFCKEIEIIIETSKLMSNSVLLQESNHRIKNNLQIVINLLNMQQFYVKQGGSRNVEEALDSVVERVQNIANVHEMLCSKRASSATIDLLGIIKSVLKTFHLNDVKVSIHADEVFIPYAKATSISMVINELLTNSVKYAFQDQPDKHIGISCVKNRNSTDIVVTDNGVGLPDGFDINNIISIGISIVKTIVMIDLRGTISFQNTYPGTRVTINIPEVIL